MTSDLGSPILGLMIGACLIALVFELSGRPIVRKSMRKRRRSGRLALSNSARRAILAGVVGGAITRWPVAVIGIGTLAYLLDGVLSARARAKHDIARTRAIARWVASLRNSIRPGNPLPASIQASAKTADPPIRNEVTVFAQRWQAGEFERALVGLSADLDHHMADLAVTALSVAHTKGSGRLGDVLDSVAETAEAEAKMMDVIESERGSVNSDVKGIVGILGVAFVILSITNFGESYRSVEGQAMLSVLLAVFAATLAWMRSLSRYERPARFLWLGTSSGTGGL